MKIISTCLAFMLVVSGKAQQFGGHPPAQKWRQIHTDTARIIYPITLDSQALRVASIVHRMAAQKPLQPGNKLKKANIVLQHQTTIANGYAGLGPFRSEFYLTPSAGSFELGSLSWVDQLAIHEYRHVQQFNNFRHGVSSLFNVLFGQEGLALAIQAAIPNWYYEGDAVYAETILSQQGRGRLPSFVNNYKSLWLAGKDYSWMKLRNGSLKDYVPGDYELGYLMVGYGREKYGAGFWQKVTRDASAYKGLFYPFQQAIKRHAGINYRQFRKQALDFYRTEVSGKQVLDISGPGKPVTLTTLDERTVTNYTYPFFAGPDSLVFLKNSYKKRPAFFVKNERGEKRIRAKDISLDEHYSYRNGRIVYSAYNPDVRWGWKDFSDIKMLDLHTGQQQTITRNRKYFWPDLSPSGRQVAATYLPASGDNALHMLNSTTGAVEQSIPHPGINLLTDNRFINDNEIVSGARYKDGSMNLVRINVLDKTIVPITPKTFSVVGNPSFYNDTVYFTAGYQGNDDLYAVSLADQKIFKLTSERLGKYQVNASGGQLYFSGFTSEGYQLQTLPVNQALWEPVDFAGEYDLLPVDIDTSLNNFLQQVDNRAFDTGKYSKATGLFNFHSYRPYYEDPVFSFSLYGENILNTLQTELYYQYNENDNDHAAGFNLLYGGLFTYLGGGMQMTFDRLVQENNTLRQFHQLDSRIGFSIPLNLTAGRSFKYFNAGSNYVMRNEFNTGFSKGKSSNDFSYLSHFINWRQQVPQARQHIFPRIGYQLSLQHRHAITSIEGYQFLGSGNILLPGIFANHHLVITGGFQQRDTLRQLFSNRLAFSRGYNEPYLSRMWRTSANYHFPLLYPDFGIAQVVYFQRLRGNMFYDFSRVYSRDKKLSADSRSTGVELYIDTKWWNEYPLSFGIRYSHLLDKDLLQPGRSANQWEIILPVSILPK